jgi:hypothetical protein
MLEERLRRYERQASEEDAVADPTADEPRTLARTWTN